MNVTVYMVVMPTGLIRDDGVESVVVIDIKLTRLAAELVQSKHPGAEVVKMSANKTV
jgi:hypothetical protein